MLLKPIAALFCTYIALKVQLTNISENLINMEHHNHGMTHEMM